MPKEYINVCIGSLLCVFLTLGGCRAKPPYPESKIIKGINFARASDIICKATGSDNWPISWGADDNLYTSYGDGWGFEPKVPGKLSLGFARVQGMPADFSGHNIRSSSGERTGGGPLGEKASGMLMVDSVLYMWVRNANKNGGYAKLAWSTDHAKSWNWGFKFPESFGCPTFLNFGPNYQGARDEFVYIYSQDGLSAYQPYDRVVLARVNRKYIKNLNSYQYFKGFDENDNPVWTSDLSKRGAVFEYTDHCFRMEVIYNPGISRYIMAVAYNFKSGWGIFEAPQPWGPWSTVYHTESWDLKQTHGYRFPTKWIQDNGKVMYLVFSGLGKGGYDAFCVRKISLIIRSN